MLLPVLASACAGAARETTRAATPAAVEGALDTAHDPANRRLLAEILADPELGSGAAKMSEAVISGILQGLTKEENWKPMEAQSRQFVSQLGADLSKSVARELRPEIVSIVEQSVDGALSRVLNEQTEQRVAAFVTALTRAVMQGVGQELASVDLASASTGQGAAALARQISRGATLGAQDAVRETKERSKNGEKRDGDILADADQAVGRGADLLSAGTLVPLGIALAAVGGLVWALLRTRRYRHASEANQQATLILTQAIQSDPNNPALQALRERLEDLGGSGTGVAAAAMRQQPEHAPDQYQRHH